MFGYMDCALGMNTSGYWFMQEGAPPLYRTGRVLDTINSEFGTRVIAYQYPNNPPGALHWPAYSPDRNPCDFYLWGPMKDLVYKKPTDLNSLKKSITDSFESIKRETLELITL